MDAKVVKAKKSKISQLSPTYSLVDSDGNSKIPNSVEVLKQYFHLLNPLKCRSHWLNFHLELYFYLSLGFTILFLFSFLSVQNVILFSIIFYVLANLINTVWYHRFCSHASFRFKKRWIPKLLLWLNPIAYREEAYVFNHLLHHKYSDTKDDPYGPHLGWLGNFFASPFYRVNRAIDEDEFEHMKKILRHIGMPYSSYEKFKKWGSVESIPHFLFRSSFANILWISLMYTIGGLELVVIWFTALFAFHAIARDFNYRGHGGRNKDSKLKRNIDFYKSTKALNQVFYGYTAGEWHNNHHAFQASANSAFLPYQIDVPFLFIKFLKLIGVVDSYNDSQSIFNRKYIHTNSDLHLSG